MKRIRYAEVTLKVTIPVYSHTSEEAQEIAKDQLSDFVSHYGPTEWEAARSGQPHIFLTKPPQVALDDLVWGDGVPEEHCTVGALTILVSEKN
jgi:hypothetical protein